MVEISHRVIEKLRTWNEEKENIHLDRLYTLALLLVLASKDDIQRSSVNEEVLNFIRGMEMHLIWKMSMFLKLYSFFL